jgi:hypothetical protein
MYTRPITVVNTGSTLSAYQVSVTLDTAELIAAGKMRSDCGDIRFYDSDGTTLLPHWLQSGANTTTTTLWTKVPSIPNGTTTIYMKYGDPALTHDNTQGGHDTWTWFDDFLGGLERYAGNPILSKQGTGWERDIVYCPRFVKNLDGTPYQDGDGKYWAFYAGGFTQTAGTQDSCGLMWSTDLISWTRYGQVLPVVPGTYYTADLVVITALHDNGVFHVFFEANRDNPPSTDYVTLSYGSASSVTGPYTLNASPILTQGAGDDSLDLYSCAVGKDGSTWKMIYTGHNASGHYNMMYATAANPEGPWTKYSNNYIWTNAANYISPSEWWKDGSTYYMTYYKDGLNLDLASAPALEGPWTHLGSIMKTVSGQWDGTWVYWASQVQKDGVWYTLYAGLNAGQISIGLATSVVRAPILVEQTWTNTYGTMAKTYGQLDYLPRDGYFTSARSSYSPGASDSWRIVAKAKVSANTNLTYQRLGQVGTDNAGASTPAVLTGQVYGQSIERLQVKNTSDVAANVGSVPYNQWYNTICIIELMKRTGYAKTTWRDASGSLLGSAEVSSQVPDITNPLGLYGASYTSAEHMQLTVFAVGKYTVAEPSVTVENEQGGVASGFSVLHRMRRLRRAA